MSCHTRHALFHSVQSLAYSQSFKAFHAGTSTAGCCSCCWWWQQRPRWRRHQRCQAVVRKRCIGGGTSEANRARSHRDRSSGRSGAVKQGRTGQSAGVGRTDLKHGSPSCPVAAASRPPRRTVHSVIRRSAQPADQPTVRPSVRPGPVARRIGSLCMLDGRRTPNKRLFASALLIVRVISASKGSTNGGKHGRYAVDPSSAAVH